MLGTLLIKEIHDSFLSLRFFIAMLLCLILIPLGMYINLKDYQKRLESYERSVTIYQQEHPNKYSVSRGGKAFRKPAPLSIFSIGLEYHYPTTIHSDPELGISFSNDRGIDNAQSLLLGKIDLLFIVSIVMSLLAVLFSFDSISGEKESGTLKLMLSNRVPRHRVLLAKLLGNYIVLFIPFIISLLAGMLILVLSGSVFVFSGDNMLYLAGIILASLLLIMVYFSLGMLVSSLTQRSSTAIIILLLLWVMGTLAYPRISTMIAEAIYPVKSDMVFELEKNALLHSIDSDERAEYSKIWNRIGDPQRSPQATPDSAQWDAATRRFMEERGPVRDRFAEFRKSSIENLEREHDNRKQTQSGIAMNISRLSPVSCFMYAVSSLAGTGLATESDLRDDARRLQDDLQRNVYDKVFRVKITGRSSSSSNFGDDNEPPRFVPSERSRNEVLHSSGVDLLLLCLYCILLFAATYTAFLRYDVR